MSTLHARRGALLVVVAGLCSLLAVLAFAFLMRMRSDAEEAARMSQDIQARVMLSSALMYVQEASRIGWGVETYGWRDVRDGRPGPRGFDAWWPPGVASLVNAEGRASSPTATFPAIGGHAARLPMYVMRTPPFAITSAVALNPVPTDAAALGLPWEQLVNYTVPDPQPVLGVRADFINGDARPRTGGISASWFRVYRLDVATFIVTCGAGASQGYRDWDEVVADGAEAVFGTKHDFLAIRGGETVLWYEAAWSDHVTGNTFMHGHYGRFSQRYFNHPDTGHAAEQPNMRQFAGTFTYIRRRFDQPDEW
ncbi:MAG TPA: hypothetical protein VEL07_20240 [Planctomycetota bacterium]|nr:hypothetical protein [Planctomycetota bacterium]